MNKILSLTDADYGRYVVRTGHSVYELDLDANTLSRRSGVTVLRGDGETINLVSIGRCEVGCGASLFVSGLAPVGDTIRLTTVVRSIEKA